MTSPTASTQSLINRIGLTIVCGFAIVWSFAALSDLARLVGIVSTFQIPITGWTVHVSWGLPLTLDVLALLATRIWLQRQAPADAVTFARRAAIGAIIASLIGNAYHGQLTGTGRLDSLIVSAVPAIALAVIVHLFVLMTRQTVQVARNTAVPGYRVNLVKPPRPSRPQAVGTITAAAIAPTAVPAAKLRVDLDLPTVPDLQIPDPFTPVRKPTAPPVVADPFAAPKRPKPTRTTSAQADDTTVLDHIRAVWDRTGQAPSGQSIRQGYGMGPKRANRLLGLVQAERTTPDQTTDLDQTVDQDDAVSELVGADQ